ncbi:hypothetical protein SAMN04488074_101177 [Lentzea albidocapillata subsp. violacea]|uniref:Carbohydrate binding module (Family 6) n=1 Tax=Lentzea albidocapillata subsp. violacea TaxID=128104 RepID=A0A1G8PXM1_9PSEU|nr:hypothetical protein SAMN04488074_101177 [Lentzea albidocapillata subsp. violacea]
MMAKTRRLKANPITCPVAGTHDLYLKFSGGNGCLLGINWWRSSEGRSS